MEFGQFSSDIPYDQQYYYESDRNNKFAWLAYGLGIVAMVIYGLINHWVPVMLRKYKLGYRNIRISQVCAWITSSIDLKYFTVEPAVVALYGAYCGINAWFILAQTKDINYEPWQYIIGKRAGKIAMGNTPLLYLFATKNDVVTLVTGLSHDKVNVLHRWIGRTIYVMVVAHMIISIRYWLSVGFLLMLEIPPTIFGMIAFGCMTVLTVFSPRFIRRLSYEFFLFNHGFCAGVMMLMALFHNGAARSHAILAIHTIVIDRVAFFIRSIINKKLLSPTGCKAQLRILDDENTVEVRIPMKVVIKAGIQLGDWKAGQHVYLRVASVRRLQWHPFTISSLHTSGEIRLVIRQQTGFTKALAKKVQKLAKENQETAGSVDIKSLFHGPYGGHYFPLSSFSHVTFIGGGTGGSFIFPVALSVAGTVPITVVWICARSCHLSWYEESIAALKDLGIVVEVHITREGAKTRPPVDMLIEPVPNMAVMACGPESLAQNVQLHTESLRRSGNDIYTYIETYTV